MYDHEVGMEARGRFFAKLVKTRLIDDYYLKYSGGVSMSVMEYDEAAAKRLDAIYMGPDIVAQRADTLKKLNIQSGETVLDIGCGPGYLAEELAKATGPKGTVFGVDLSEPLINTAIAKNDKDWLRYEHADATDLPCEDASFDVVVSTQVAEYVPDIEKFCSEVYRVLKPGGRALILATDWDAVSWYSRNPERMDRVMRAFAPHCADSRLPRTLRTRLANADLKLDGVSYFPILNIDRYEGCYGEGIVPFIVAYVKDHSDISEEELQAWVAEQDQLDVEGAHFFSTGRFSFCVTKPV
jgi:ubiquinone/menaquinone biosynthesis C-methylase UbiE